MNDQLSIRLKIHAKNHFHEKRHKRRMNYKTNRNNEFVLYIEKMRVDVDLIRDARKIIRDA